MATDYFTMMRDAVGSYGDGLDLARARRKADAEEARKETLFNQGQEQYRRKLGIQQEEDSAAADVTSLASVGAVNYGGETGARGVQTAEGDSLREVRRTGLPASEARTGAAAVTARKADALDNNLALTRLAAARRDSTALQQLTKDRPEAEYGRGMTEKTAAYSGDEAQIAEAIKHINTNHKILTFGDPDKHGMRPMSATMPDGRALFLQLSKAEQARLWAAAQNMGTHPQQALRDIAAINKNLATALAADANVDLEVNKGRTEQFKAASMDDFHRASIANDAARIGVARAAANNRPQNVREFVDAKGNSVLVDLSQMPRDKDGVVQIPQGLRPPRARPEFTPKDVSDYIESRTMTDPAFKKIPRAQQEAVAIRTLSSLHGGQGAATGGGLENVYANPPGGNKPAITATPAAAPQPAAVIYTHADQQLINSAKAAGYTASEGRDGNLWFSKVTNGQGENLTAEQVASKLGLIY